MEMSIFKKFELTHAKGDNGPLTCSYIGLMRR